MRATPRDGMCLHNINSLWQDSSLLIFLYLICSFAACFVLITVGKQICLQGWLKPCSLHEHPQWCKKQIYIWGWGCYSGEVCDDITAVGRNLQNSRTAFTGVEVGARKNCMKIKEEDRNLCDLCKFIILKLIIRNQVNVPCNFNSLRKKNGQKLYTDSHPPTIPGHWLCLSISPRVSSTPGYVIIILSNTAGNSTVFVSVEKFLRLASYERIRDSIVQLQSLSLTYWPQSEQPTPG